jgi:myo-inositol-1(or 4)-monophosphatase
LNGDPLKVSSTAAIIESLLVTGFPYDVQENTEPYLRVFGAFIARARAVRRLGSAAIDLCYVAAGRMDGFWEAQLNPWDTRAGALIVQEAGGRVTGMDGQPWDPASGHILASNGTLHDAMLEILRGAQ